MDKMQRALTAADDDGTRDELVAWDREETDSCERGTPGCCIHHTRDSDCQTW